MGQWVVHGGKPEEFSTRQIPGHKCLKYVKYEDTEQIRTSGHILSVLSGLLLAPIWPALHHAINKVPGH